MSNGLGAAFGGLMLLAVLSGLAGLLGIAWTGAVLSRRRTGTVPHLLRDLSVVAVLTVTLVAGFAILALFDEAAMLAAVFVATVLIPLGGAGIYLHRVTELSGLDTLATAGVAWSMPFLLGLVVTFSIPPVINRVFELAPGESLQLGVYWVAPVIGGVVVVLGALPLGSHVSKTWFATSSS